MSSRYAADTVNACSRQEDNRCEAEAPLPTYDEVIGNDSPNYVHVGFKNDVLLQPNSSTDQGQSSAHAPNREHDGAGDVRRFSSCKPNRIGTILVILGMILIPMCGLIIILQVKICATERSQLQQYIDKLNSSYTECTVELSAFEESQNLQENRIRDLNYSVQKLNKDNKRLQAMLFKKNANSIEK